MSTCMSYLISLQWLPGQLCWREDSGNRAYWEDIWGWLPRAAVKEKHKGHIFATFPLKGNGKSCPLQRHLNIKTCKAVLQKKAFELSTCGRVVQEWRGPALSIPVPKSTSLTMKIHLIEKCHHFWPSMKVIFYATQENKITWDYYSFTIPIG